MSIADLTTPALLLDLDVLEKNLSRMQERANRLGVALRPHGKTHKCPEIAKRQIELGAIGLTVATLKEARAFASAGITDLTWAFPLPPCHAGAAVALARAITLRLVVDSGEAVDALLAAGAGKDSPPVHVWLKVDCGYHRAGVDPGSGYAATLAQRLATEPPLVFDGILTHSGHAYDVASSEEAARVAEEERSVMTSFAGKLREGGIPVPGISVGSTPAMSAVKNLDGVTEIRPGNYAFYDGAQWAMGSCGLDDCAVTVLASVISHQPGASWFVTDAGALSLSKDPGATHVVGNRGLGSLFTDLRGVGLVKDLVLTSLSQEHGKVQARDAARIEGLYRVGDKVRILEHHSCLAVALFDEMTVVRGQEVVDHWRVMRER